MKRMRRWFLIFCLFLISKQSIYATENAIVTNKEIVYNDDFSENNIESNYELKDMDGISLQDGGVKLDVLSVNNYLRVKNIQEEINDLDEEEGYSIKVDAKKLNSTNGTIQIMFKGDSEALGNRYVLAINSQGSAFFRKLYNGENIELSRCNINFTEKMISIELKVKGNKVTFLCNGEEKMTYTDISNWNSLLSTSGIINMTTGAPILLDNLIIEKEVKDNAQTSYQVVTVVSTDGIENDTTGGTITVDKKQGVEGETITLSVSPNHGYIFAGYSSYKLSDGVSTDGLMPITDDQFQLNSKFGDVKIVARFVKREVGKYEVFYDDFSYDSITDLSYYTNINTLNNIVIDQGELILNNETFFILDDSVGDIANEDYRITVDVKKANTTAGTMQIMFKGDENFNNRYVFVLNGNRAVLLKFTPERTEILGANFNLGTDTKRISLQVVGNTVTCYADGAQLLQYTDADNWKDMENRVGIRTMTNGAAFAFDNLLIERIPNEIPITVKVMLEEEIIEDSTGQGGNITLSAYGGVPGDTINISVIEKAGYYLKEITLNNELIDSSNNSFIIPQEIEGPLEVIAVFTKNLDATFRDYYIDSIEGDDNNDGSINAPWRTLNMLDQCGTVQPGSRIYLKKGSIFENEDLTFKGSGTKDHPIIIDAYGEGDVLPVLNGNGVVENVVSLFNQEYIEIQNLEITNESPQFNTSYTLNGSNNRSLALRAINVSAKNYGLVSGIKIKDCYIHNINGNISLKWNGGIFFDVQVDIVEGNLTGTPTKYDDILIEGCTFINVDRSAIKLVSSGWCNQWEPNDRTKPVNWYPSTNVVVRNNYMEKIGGDGITVRDTDGALVEYNLARDCRFQNTGYNVAMWPFQASNTVIQYNESYETHGTTDGQGFDCDHASSYSVVQYNYSHNNEGGFMLIMGGYPHTAPTVRYNISQNDYDKTFEFAQGIPNGTMIYNNTIYSDNVLGRGVILLSNTGAGVGTNDMYFFNNVFYYPSGQNFYSGQTAILKNKTHLYNNAYGGGIQYPEQETKPIVLTESKDRIWLDIGTAPEINETTDARTGGSGYLDGYKLCEGSILIDKGVRLEEAVEAFGGTMDAIYNGSTMSPRNVYEKAKSEGNPSLKYIMGNYMPQIEGVSYDKDFFGTSILSTEIPDIGAAEYMK